MNKHFVRNRVLRICASALIVPCLIASAVTPTRALEPNGTGLVIRDWLTNDPAYSFSDEYKTSVWYENFSALTLSDNARNNVLRIALSQLGYHEGNSQKDVHGRNSSGTKNYTEFARLLRPAYNNNAYEWCACFVNWCLNQANIDYVYGEISCHNWVTWLKNNGQYKKAKAYGGDYTPQPADFIFFSWSSTPSSSDRASHIGFVLYTTATHVYTIEGNTSDCVAIRSYRLNDTSIIGYGTPDYTIGTERTISYMPQAQRLPGLYIASGTGIKLYERAESSSAYVTVPNGAMVTVSQSAPSSNTWVAVEYKGNVGYIKTGTNATLSLLSPATYSLVYTANGGENAPDTQYDFCYSEVSVTNAIPIKDGAEFLGWAYAPDAAEGDDLIQAGDRIVLEKKATALYAIWRDIPVETEPEADTDIPAGGTADDTTASDESTTAEEETSAQTAYTVYETTAAPETLTTITGGASLSNTGCRAIIPAFFSVIVPLSLAALLLWRKHKDIFNNDSEI